MSQPASQLADTATHIRGEMVRRDTDRLEASSDSFMREDEATNREHFDEIAQAELVAQATVLHGGLPAV